MSYLFRRPSTNTAAWQFRLGGVPPEAAVAGMPEGVQRLPQSVPDRRHPAQWSWLASRLDPGSAAVPGTQELSQPLATQYRHAAYAWYSAVNRDPAEALPPGQQSLSQPHADNYRRAAYAWYRAKNDDPAEALPPGVQAISQPDRWKTSTYRAYVGEARERFPPTTTVATSIRQVWPDTAPGPRRAVAKAYWFDNRVAEAGVEIPPVVPPFFVPTLRARRATEEAYWFPNPNESTMPVPLARLATMGARERYACTIGARPRYHAMLGGRERYAGAAGARHS